MKDISIDMKTVADLKLSLQTLQMSNNFYIANMSKSLLLIFHQRWKIKINHEKIWQIILDTKGNEIFSVSNVTNDKYFTHLMNNVFDGWCHSLCDISSKKFYISVVLQLMSILGDAISQIINENKNIDFLVSSQGLNTLLAIVHQLINVCTADTEENTEDIIKLFFVNTLNIQTLCMLCNPHFLLKYVGSHPYSLPSLFTELMQSCSQSFAILLNIYQYIIIDTQKNEQKKNLYNFHKITLKCELISSILKFIQISTPSQKVQACSLKIISLFYV